MKLEVSRQLLEKYSNTRFHDNPSSGIGVQCGRTDGRTDVTKLMAAFGSFANPRVRKGIDLAMDKPNRLIVLRIPL
jgi:hypothetical protein